MSTVRTFIAVEATAEIRAAVAGLIDELRQPAAAGTRKASPVPAGRKLPRWAQIAPKSSAITWVKPENLHFTLNFLGDVAEETIPEVVRAVERAAARQTPFDLEVAGVGAFPRPQRPQTVWVGVVGGTEPMQLLQAEIEDELAALDFRPEDRAFTPHLTIARVRSLAAGDPLPERLRQAHEFAAGTMRVAEVVVFASELKPSGAVHTPLARAALGESNGD